MEQTRRIKLIRINDNEYRLSGAFDYESRETKWVTVDDEDYSKTFIVEKSLDIDLSWEKKTPRRLWRPDPNEILYSDDEYQDWHCCKVDFMEIFGFQELKLWMPDGFTSNLIHQCVGSDSQNDYVAYLQALDGAGAFKKIKGRFWVGKKRDRFDKDAFDVIVDRYGFNNYIGFQFEFKNLIQYDLLKLTEYLHYYDANGYGRSFGHTTLINRIIKDYYQKTESITDSDRVNILSNHIMGLRVEN